MSKYNGLNYTTAFLSDLDRLDFSSMLTAKQEDSLKQLIGACTVFDLPPEGYPVGKTELEGLVGEDLTLPFPFVCLEFPKNAREKDGLPVNQIVLTMELEPDPELLDDLEIDSDVRDCWKAGSNIILVRTLAQLRGSSVNRKLFNGWVVSPYQGLLFCSAAYRKKAFGANEKQFTTYLAPVYHNVITLLEKIYRSVTEYDKELKRYQEITNEACYVVCAFMEALTCPTVHIKTARKACPIINARRARKGKKPLNEIKVLNIEVPGVTPERVNRGGTHASPRLHIRRKHTRVLASGREVRVRQALVGKASLGTIDKTYTVNKSIWKEGEDDGHTT